MNITINLSIDAAGRAEVTPLVPGEPMVGLGPCVPVGATLGHANQVAGSLPPRTMLAFGDHGEWGISLDDGCLRFHPDRLGNPGQTAHWIWREAFQEVERLGGFDGVVARLRSMASSQTRG